MRACPKHASERSLYCTGLSKGLSCAAPPSAMFAATVRPAPHPAASGGGPRGDDSPFRSTRRQALAGRRGAPRLCDAFPQVRLLMAAASPCATPPAGVPASSRRDCDTCAIRAEARAVFRPCAGLTGTTSASGGASSMPRRRGGSAAVRRARRGGKSGSGGAPPREALADASRRGLGGEHAGRRSRQAAHGRRRAEEGAKGAPAAEGTPSAPSKWMQPEGRAPAAGLASAAGACGRWDAPFPRGVEAPLRAHGFRSAARTGKCDTLRNPRN